MSDVNNIDKPDKRPREPCENDVDEECCVKRSKLEESVVTQLQATVPDISMKDTENGEVMDSAQPEDCKAKTLSNENSSEGNGLGDDDGEEQEKGDKTERKESTDYNDVSNEPDSKEKFSEEIEKPVIKLSDKELTDDYDSSQVTSPVETPMDVENIQPESNKTQQADNNKSEVEKERVCDKVTEADEEKDSVKSEPANESIPSVATKTSNNEQEVSHLPKTPENGELVASSASNDKEVVSCPEKDESAPSVALEPTINESLVSDSSEKSVTEEKNSSCDNEQKKENGSVTKGVVVTNINTKLEEDVESETNKSEGSEKENVVNGIKSEHSNSPDVIMLSDEEIEHKEKDNLRKRAHYLKKIKELQNQLRNEEATLVLLKKLRQSQMTPVQESNHQTAPSSSLSLKSVTHQQQALHAVRQHSGPPPLVKGAQPSSSKLAHGSNQNVHMQRSQAVGAQPQSRGHTQQGPPPLVMTQRGGNGQQIHPQQHSHGSRSNLHQNMNMFGGTKNRNQQPMQQQQPVAPLKQPAAPQPPPPPAPQHPPQDTQTPAQRQAAAKQALRKQLEKTLLQIPPPKPPPPEMNFIPSLACPDFILLLGLEEVVNHMIDFQLIAKGQKNPDERFVCTPFTCVQCQSDFTPVWKREKPGSKNVICEHCVTTNQKKALKQEHTNRLKSAFVKALQQEQEIERMQASTPTPASPVANNSQSHGHGSSSPMIPGPSAAAAAANAAVAAAASFRSNAEQIRQHHTLLQQAQQAQLRAGQPLGLQAFSHRAPFTYQLPFAKAQDLQRQYLLDMIPRGSMPWKQ